MIDHTSLFTEIVHPYLPKLYITIYQLWYIAIYRLQYGCQQGVLTYLDNNRQKFKSQILAYYNKYKTELKFIRYSKDYKNDCKKKNKIFGYYDVDWKLLGSN